MRRRHLHRKERQKRRNILIVSSIALVFCFCVGYSAFSTQLSLNAKGNVKKVPTASESLKKTVTTSGDGLYVDSTETGRYVYKGKSPNNYITFSGSTYRIISVESDGTLKIIGDSIGNYTWNDDGTNDWSAATLNTYLNGTYYNSLGISSIVSHTFNVGAVGSDTSSLESTISEEKKATWTGNVGLINVSDYLKANTNSEKCGTISLVNSNYEECQSTNYLLTGSYYWTIAPWSGGSISAWFVLSGGSLGNDDFVDDDDGGARPVLYLSSDITLSGQGTELEPYTIN